MFRTSLDEEIAVEIERPSEEVWAFVSNGEHLPQWLEEFEAVVKETEGPIARGTVFRYTLAPGHRSATFEVVAWEPGRRFAWDGPPLRSRGGGVRPRGFFEVIAAGERGTRFVSRYQPELTGTMALMRPILKRWLRRQRTADTERLKQLLESRRDAYV
jgi:uncharacterized protein YndB with AHSA1/START domain